MHSLPTVGSPHVGILTNYMELYTEKERMKHPIQHYGFLIVIFALMLKQKLSTLNATAHILRLLLLNK